MATAADRSPSTGDENVAASTAVVEAVSSHSDTPVLELPPLRDAVDPDALNALFSGSRTAGEVTFRYTGHAVTVHEDGTVTVSDAE